MDNPVSGIDSAKAFLKFMTWGVSAARHVVPFSEESGWKTCISSFIETHRDQFIPVNKSSRFLNYDINELIRYYNAEDAVGNCLPYTEVYNFIEHIKHNRAIRFKLKQRADIYKTEEVQNPIVRNVLSDGFHKKMVGGSITHDSDVIRLLEISKDRGHFVLTVQKAKYSDQVKTNMLADYYSDRFEKTDTLRNMFRSEIGGSLPNLSDGRLSNTIGVAVMLMYLDNGEWTPLMMPRTSKSRDGVAVFEGGWHCSASGSAEWTDLAHPRFRDLIEDDIYKEIKEEIGVSRSEISNLTPVSLCREFSRLGKPQFFFTGFLHLNHDQIMHRIDRARLMAKKKGENVEYLEYPIFSFRNLSTSNIFGNIVKRQQISDVRKLTEFGMGMSTEGAASLYYTALAFPWLLPKVTG